MTEYFEKDVLVVTDEEVNNFKLASCMSGKTAEYIEKKIHEFYGFKGKIRYLVGSADFLGQNNETDTRFIRSIIEDEKFSRYHGKDLVYQCSQDLSKTTEKDIEEIKKVVFTLRYTRLIDENFNAGIATLDYAEQDYHFDECPFITISCTRIPQDVEGFQNLVNRKMNCPVKIYYKTDRVFDPNYNDNMVIEKDEEKDYLYGESWTKEPNPEEQKSFKITEETDKKDEPERKYEYDEENDRWMEVIKEKVYDNESDLDDASYRSEQDIDELLFEEFVDWDIEDMD